MKDNTNLLIAVIVIILSVLAFIFLPFPQKAPSGLPDTYYDTITAVEDSRTEIVVYSDLITFNRDLTYRNIQSLYDLEDYNTNDIYVIIDMNKYNIFYSNSDEIEKLYSETCYYIVIANYKSSDSSITISFLNSEELNSDLIFVQNASICNTDFITSYYSTTFPDQKFLDFAILENIERNYYKID